MKNLKKVRCAKVDKRGDFKKKIFLESENFKINDIFNMGILIYQNILCLEMRIKK